MSQVFRALEQVSNRYELCRLAARMTRRLHFMASDTQAALENTFELIGMGRGRTPVAGKAADTTLGALQER